MVEARLGALGKGSANLRLLCLMFWSSFVGNGGGLVVGALGSGNCNGRAFIGGGGGAGFWSGWNGSGVAIAVTSMAGFALVATLVYSRRSSLKSPWYRRRRKHALSPRLWKSLFAPDGKLRDGVKFLKKVRSGGVDPSIRAEVWPFLLGVYDLNSTKVERNAVRTQKRKEYENLRRKCRRLLKQLDENYMKSGELGSQTRDSPSSEDAVSARESLSTEGEILEEEEGEEDEEQTVGEKDSSCKSRAEDEQEDEDKSGLTQFDASAVETESSDSESSVEESETPPELIEEIDPKDSKTSKIHTVEDVVTWQRIIRLDAVRANAEWVIFSPSQASVSEARACRCAQVVGLRDYDQLEPCRIYHAARLVAILEAYAIYDPEIGYCQGMSDLLSPIIAVMEEDHEAFWCFVGFMKKARHNFRLDEVGIRRQLNTVSKIIKYKDSYLYKHLEKLQAEDCFFVYRMVVVMFRRELSFEQTLCLWEVMWADQAAIRARIGKSAWGRIRQRAPPTEDLLLYAIAASVLQRRKLIIEKYSSMDEIMRECNSMTGQLDVWKLLDDAHDLVVTLHDKIRE
ncbi:rab GTPase-activating protein 22-like isoform X1 [Aristolochia californica]|uniref:rab GTPase-activating protein 22-like isoform X1 n=1 Tax=Aristolochia californica TaxID=171875 RepID=UPI0035D65E41